MRAEERILGGLEAGFKQFPWAAIVTVTGKIVIFFKDFFRCKKKILLNLFI